MYGQKGGTNVFRVPGAEAAADVRILWELRELWRLDKLLFHVRLAHLWPVKVAAIGEHIELRICRTRLRRRSSSI